MVELDHAFVHFMLRDCRSALVMVPGTALEGKSGREVQIQITRGRRVDEDYDGGVGLQFKGVLCG